VQIWLHSKRPDQDPPEWTINHCRFRLLSMMQKVASAGFALKTLADAERSQNYKVVQLTLLKTKEMINLHGLQGVNNSRSNL
jgi:hypothetical protein